MRSSRDELTNSRFTSAKYILGFQFSIWESIGVHLCKVQTRLGTDELFSIRADVSVLGVQETAETVPVAAIPCIQNLTMNVGNIRHEDPPYGS